MAETLSYTVTRPAGLVSSSSSYSSSSSSSSSSTALPMTATSTASVSSSSSSITSSSSPSSPTSSSWFPSSSEITRGSIDTIRGIFRHSDSLHRVSHFIIEYENRLNEVGQQLSSSITTQIEETKLGVHQIIAAEKMIQEIRNNFTSIDEYCSLVKVREEKRRGEKKREKGREGEGRDLWHCIP